jgi:hypothetical protein
MKTFEDVSLRNHVFFRENVEQRIFHIFVGQYRWQGYQFRSPVVGNSFDNSFLRVF